MTALSLAAFSQASLPEEARQPFYVYADEFQSFTMLSVANMAVELRKYGIDLVLAHQYLHQRAPEIRHAVLGNAGTFVAFRTGAEDASYLAREFEPVFRTEDFIGLPNYRISALHDRRRTVKPLQHHGTCARRLLRGRRLAPKSVTGDVSAPRASMIASRRRYQEQPMTASATPVRFRDRDIVFANGCVGHSIDFETANPINFYQAISAPGEMTKTTIDGKLFLPEEQVKGEPFPAVIVVPGSLGVAVSHLQHAETITNLGAVVLVIDPFGARAVSSTVANQTQYSFAASAYDVLAAARTPKIDPARIGAQGHSRGGSAVLSAAMTRLAAPVLPDGPRLCAVFAAYPWSGEQFLDPDVGGTTVRAVIGDHDDWCLPQQVQGHIQAIRLSGGDASIRIFEDAAHSFDRETPLERIPEASISPSAPTAYIADDGAFVHPIDGRSDPRLTDRDLMIYALKAGYGVKGATIGSKPGQPEMFRDDMIRFWRNVFWGTPN